MTPLDGDHRSRVCIDLLLLSPGLRYESNCAIRATHRERIRRLKMHDRIEIDQKNHIYSLVMRTSSILPASRSSETRIHWYQRHLLGSYPAYHRPHSTYIRSYHHWQWEAFHQETMRQQRRCRYLQTSMLLVSVMRWCMLSWSKLKKKSGPYDVAWWLSLVS